MAGLGDLLPNLPNMEFMGMIILFGVIAVIIGLVLGGALYLYIILASQKKITEINGINQSIKTFGAREKKNRSHKKQLYIGGKISKFLPNIQQKDVFMQGKKENIFLLKDNNGLHHTLRIPNQEEIEEFYDKVKGIDLSKEVNEIKEADTEEEKLSLIDKFKDKFKGVERKNALNVVGTIYLLPNPMENIEWLADEQNQANNTFATGLMKHPLLVLLGTLTISAVTFIITLVISKMM